MLLQNDFFFFGCLVVLGRIYPCPLSFPVQKIGDILHLTCIYHYAIYHQGVIILFITRMPLYYYISPGAIILYITKVPYTNIPTLIALLIDTAGGSGVEILKGERF